MKRTRLSERLGENSSPSNFEVIKFLWERAHAESTLFWARNSVFIVVNPLAFAKALEMFVKQEAPYPVFALLSISGIAFCVIWIIMTYRGRQYAHWYLEDARALIAQDPSLTSRFELAMKTKGNSATSKNVFEDIAKISDGEASSWTYVFAIWCAVAWLAMLTCSIYQLIKT